MLVNAAAGSPKNIVPVREIATSNDTAGKGWICASACSKLTLPMSCPAASRRASSIIRAERSTPSACPGLAAPAASRVAWPVPQPMSSTRSPRAMPQAAMNVPW